MPRKPPPPPAAPEPDEKPTLVRLGAAAPALRRLAERRDMPRSGLFREILGG
jgi:hypothetical protein